MTAISALLATMWRVLIIDDSPDDRAEVRRLLLRGSERRYNLAQAETGAAGLRAVLDADPALVDPRPGARLSPRP